MNKVQHVFLVGAKSLGAYGGYETFVNKLTEYHQNNPYIQYHVACKANGDGHMDESVVSGISKIVKDKLGNTKEFWYHNARCFKIQVPNVGSAQAIFYDLAAINQCCEYIKENNIMNPIIYIMACRIGPFMPAIYHKVHKLGGKIFVNPDGHEWKRGKWNCFIRKYWKISEKMMVERADLIVCDSVAIEKYIQLNYISKDKKQKKIKTEFIAYGAEVYDNNHNSLDDELLEWYSKHEIEANKYYLIVGRFVPENNYELMINQFMRSESDKCLVIITNVNQQFLSQLQKKLNFQSDHRIKFVGTVYNQRLLSLIRCNAYAYLHGHEVGGTNPSLLEALGSTNLNLLLDVDFNREVALDTAFYWKKGDNSLTDLINKCDKLSLNTINEKGKGAKERIANYYSWSFIASRYERLFLSELNDAI